MPSVDGASWAWLDRRLDDVLPFQWHHHPEFELTLTLNSVGQRFIGDHIGEYGDGDLVLVGPNLPHTWSSREKCDAALPHRALVMWFRPEWAATFVSGLPEFARVSMLLGRARSGLQFSPTTAAALRPRIEALFGHPPAERLLDLLGVLRLLAEDVAAVPLATPAASFGGGIDRTRIDKVLDFVHLNYAEGISIAALADIAALSPSGLHRLFVRHTRQTISEYVTRLRIGEACALLSSTSRPIAHIAADVGYNALANFNRQFRDLKGMTPRAWRRQFAR